MFSHLSPGGGLKRLEATIQHRRSGGDGIDSEEAKRSPLSPIFNITLERRGQQ
ncbi:MAG: hypothetical protein JSY10_09685 [Paenibacillus sp.]|nr:hypothetical protein [Paenibacillus sp.]